jgi:hypothetical protein
MIVLQQGGKAYCKIVPPFELEKLRKMTSSRYSRYETVTFSFKEFEDTV